MPPGYYPIGPYGPLPPAPPRTWTVFLAFTVAFTAGCIGAGLVALVIAFAIHGPEIFNPEDPGSQDRLQSAIQDPRVLLPMLGATQVVIGGVALGAAFFSPTPLVRRLRLVPAKLPWYGYPIVALGTLALGMTLGILIEMLGFGDHGVLQEFEEAMGNLRGVMIVIAAAVIGLAPGFGEELLFRGYIQTRLRQRWPRLLALLTASVMFGLLHMDLVQSPMAVLLGLWLGEVADRTGSIWPAIVGHTFNNAAATVLSAVVPAESDAMETWSWLAITVPVFALCLVYVLMRRVVEPEPDPVPAPPPVPQTSPFWMPPPTGPGV